ncbi:HD domain-containing protein [Cytobacillus sp. Hm23]
MKIIDSIYGEFIIEGVLEELINCKEIQRLKYVHQGGASYLVNEKWNVTRYEHSVGVMLLIRMLGGSTVEQIAGLLHDISHTAFSHVVDFVFENSKEDYHEKLFIDVIRDSEVPEILRKYGYNYKKLLFNMDQWTLLEQPSPELCADRVDSTLRDMYEYGQISLSSIRFFLDHLVVINGKMYVEELTAAEWFVETYYKEVIGFFLDPVNVFGYKILSKTMKLALVKNIIYRTDLLRTDEEVMELLRKAENPEINSLLSQLYEGKYVIEDERSFDFHLKKKLRLIDPSVWLDDKLRRSSQLSSKIRSMTDDAERKSKKGVYIKLS